MGILGALLDIVGHNGDLMTVFVSAGTDKRTEPSWDTTRPKKKKEEDNRKKKGALTFLKSKAASISSMTYNGVGL